MRKKLSSQNNHSNNKKILILFIGVILVLIVVSICKKAFSIVQKSQFNGENIIIIQVITDTKNDSNWNTEFLSFAPDKKSISLLKIHSKKKENINKTLSIPIDSSVEFSDSSMEKEYREQESVGSKVSYLFFHFYNLHSSLTIFDIVRLYWYTQSVPQNLVAVKEITLPQPSVMLDKISLSLFTDYTITQENNSIEIINATGEGGLGNRLARFISNMGGNVVAVTTSLSGSRDSEISYYKEKSYTFNRLSKVLRFLPRQRKEQGISDIIITIGKDKVTKEGF